MWEERGAERLLWAKGDLLEIFTQLALYVFCWISLGPMLALRCVCLTSSRLAFQGPGLHYQVDTLFGVVKCGKRFSPMVEGNGLISIIFALLTDL